MEKFLRFGLLFFTITLFTTTSNSQKWYEMTLEDQVNIDDVKQEAEKYFAVIGTGSHTGYKGYRRWLYNASLHADDNGDLYSDDHILKETRKFNKNKTKQRRADTDGNWSAVGPFNYTTSSSWSPGQGRVTAIAVEPVDQDLLFVSSPGGGIWRSNNAGTSWEPKGDNLENMSIWAIGIDPNNSNHILHLNSGSDILESFDQGDNWNTLTSLGRSTRNPRMIKFHPTNSNIYFVSEGGGLFKTTNSGVSFTEVITSSIEDVFFKPGDINTMYASGNDFWKSTDLGENWTKVTNGIAISERIKITVTEGDPNRVYLVQKSGSGFGRIYKSTDSGNSFQIMSDIDNGAPNYLGSQAARDMAIMASNSNPDEVHIAGLNNYRSQNSGETFTSLANWNRSTDPSYIHADVEIMINVNETLYAGSDGGIYRSTNAGDNYTDLTLGGLAISQFYRLGGSATYPGTGVGSDPNRLVAGAQDNGTLVGKGTNKDWLSWLGADGMECFIDYSNDDIIYGTSQFGSFYRSTNGGVSNSRIAKPIDGDGAWVTPFEIDPQVPTTIYSGFDEVYKSTNSGGDWEAITTGQTGGSNIDEIAIAPSNNNYIYFADGTNLWVSTNAQNANRTWRQVSGISGTVNYISIDPNDPSHALLANTSTRIYETKDAGLTWDEISGNLPNIGASCVLIDNAIENGIYVGMTQGVYYKDDTMNEWELFGNGLPNSDNRELEINYEANKLRIATYGRGIWEIGIFGSSISPKIIVETEGEKCLGDPILLSVENNPDWESPVSYQWFKNGVLITGATTTTYTALEEANYSVQVTANEASGVSIGTNINFVDGPAAPSVTAEQLCGAGPVTLTATATENGIIKWYSDAAGTNEIAEGDSYTTDISQTSSFYVKQLATISVSKVGKVDNSDLTGRFHQGDSYLIIDVNNPFILKSVKVYAEDAGDRTFELLNDSDEVLLSKTINLPAGESRVNLDFSIPKGVNLKIGITGAAQLYRTEGDVAYPFIAEGIVTIKGSTAANNSLGFYYYLYDWEIEPNTPACYSSVSEATAVVLRKLQTPEVEDQIICSTGDVTLTATTTEDGTIRWYNSEDPSVIIGTGATITTPVNSTSTFLIDTDKSTEITNGGMQYDVAQGGTHAGNFGLRFDVLKAVNLSSAQLYAFGAGDRVIMLVDENGNTIYEKTVTLTDGLQRVQLDLDLEVGVNYKIGFASGSNIFRSNTGVNYPINISDLIAINRGFNFGTQEDVDGFYYYLYDWELTEESETCPSDKAKLTVTVDQCTGLSDYENENLIVFPNPSTGIVNLKLPEEFDLKAIEVTDIRGNTFLAYGEYVEQIDLQGFNSGIYLVKVAGEQGTKIFKVEIH